jgi:hypothetical protein
MTMGQGPVEVPEQYRKNTASFLDHQFKAGENEEEQDEGSVKAKEAEIKYRIAALRVLQEKRHYEEERRLKKKENKLVLQKRQEEMERAKIESQLWREGSVARESEVKIGKPDNPENRPSKHTSTKVVKKTEILAKKIVLPGMDETESEQLKQPGMKPRPTPESLLRKQVQLERSKAKSPS